MGAFFMPTGSEGKPVIVATIIISALAFVLTGTSFVFMYLTSRLENEK